MLKYNKSFKYKNTIFNVIMDVGIVSYGGYIPKYRIFGIKIADMWGHDKNIPKSLGVECKSVANVDEDACTISVEAARIALKRAKISANEIGAIYVGSESHSYAVKPTSTIVAEAIGATQELTAADYEFACKAGTAAIQTCMGLVKSGMIKYGLAIGSDTSQSAPGDMLEYTAAAGGAAFIVGSENLVAKINHTVSITTDTPDFWRREGSKYPFHGGRFTGEPAYFKHILECTQKLFSIANTRPSDYKYAIFHQPNGKFPMRAGTLLGFSKEQILPGLVVTKIGNTYSGSAMLGLCNVLDIAEENDRILVTAYGSGAGSDSFDITVTEKINYMRDNFSINNFINNCNFVDYATYIKWRGKIEYSVNEI